ncbi:hypothetical protein ACEPAI_7546 [Sanghuangporus weigelae]
MAASNGLETFILKDGIKVIERFFDVPLDYSKPDGDKIRVFARNMIPLKKLKSAEEECDLPYMLYLQGEVAAHMYQTKNPIAYNLLPGGPGFEVSLGAARRLAEEIHERGYQTIWLDQRGTGLSTPISADLLENKSDEEKANYLKNFRADNIVRDCEYIRGSLLSHNQDPSDRKWSLLGQSFGGFIALNYLSFFPEGLKEVFLTGGLAPIVEHPDPVYEKTIHRVASRNKIYYEKYTQNIQRIRNILAYLENNDVVLPNGGRLSVSRWLQLGMKFGMTNGIDEVHELVLRATNDLELFGKLSYKLLQSVQDASSFDANPIYAILQEAIYCQGLYGLRPFKKAADMLAEYDGWENLYDEKQLVKNEVKVTAASYYDDMYVDFDLAQETAAKVRGTEQFITNQMFHDGLRLHTKEVTGKLFEISKREYV